jgi:hypothetical protein
MLWAAVDPSIAADMIRDERRAEGDRRVTGHWRPENGRRKS